MSKSEIFKTNDYYTKDELEDIKTILSMCIDSLSESIIESDSFIEYVYFRKKLSSIRKLDRSISKLIRIGGK